MSESAEQEVESEGWTEVGCAGNQSSGRHRESPGNPLGWLATGRQAISVSPALAHARRRAILSLSLSELVSVV